MNSGSCSWQASAQLLNFILRSRRYSLHTKRYHYKRSVSNSAFYVCLVLFSHEQNIIEKDLKNSSAQLWKAVVQIILWKMPNVNAEAMQVRNDG